MLFGALLIGVPLHPVLKMLVGIAGTTVLCLASYAWWVRGRWLGHLLNGRPAAPAVQPAAAADAA
jgi:hypothetical protein